MFNQIKFTLFLLFVSLFCLTVSAQEKELPSGAIKSVCGYLVVWNEPGNFYTLKVDGNDVRQLPTEQIQFNVDGMPLQVVTPTIKSFLKDREKADAKAVLAAHRDWEAKYLEGQYKEKLKIESFPQKLPNGEEALLWQIDVPKSAKSNVKKQTYLTTVKGDHIFMLSSIVSDKISEKLSHKLLFVTILGLKAGDKPMDLEIIQKYFQLN